MNTQPLIFSTLKADFLERTRRPSFRLTICIAIYLGYAVNTGQILINLGGYRGIYNSAWVGSLMAIVINFFLGLVGFYLVNNAIGRDERTGVGQILAATRLTRAQYLLGKWLSNLAVLSALVGILVLAALFMQLMQGEDARVQIWALVAPFLFLAMPMVALVAALAVLFETVRWLKGGPGNLAYFILFIGLLVAGIFLPQASWLDLIGINLVGSSMKAAARAAFPTYNGTFTLAMISGKPLESFVWPGLDWTARLMTQRLLWIVVSPGVALLGLLFFNRFDSTGRAASIKKTRSLPIEHQARIEAGSHAGSLKMAQLTPVNAANRFRPNLLRLTWYECLLMIKGWKWYWLAGLAALWIGCVIPSNPSLRRLAFMLMAIFPVLLWSKMGVREAEHQTGQLIFQSASPLARQFTAAWLAGLLFTTLAMSGVLLGRWINQEPLALGAWILSVLCVPSLAITLGVWSRDSKAFEVIYPILWYLGPFNPQNGLAILDYLGMHPQAPVLTEPLLFAAFSFLMLGIALIGRKRQLFS